MKTSVRVAADTHAIAIMAKAPVSGAVKSRLVPPLSAGEAAELSRCFIRDVGAAIESAAATADDGPARIAGLVAFTPAAMESAFDGLLPASFRLIAQRGEGLTERLTNAAKDLFSLGYSSVSLMNADSPTIPPATLAGAVAGLARPGDRIALVGAEDGGYCLIGLKQPHRRLFEEITWSTAVVFAETLDRARELGLEVVQMPPWYDVDDAASLRRLVDELAGAMNPAVAAGFIAPATRAWLQRALRAGGLARRLVACR